MRDVGPQVREIPYRSVPRAWSSLPDASDLVQAIHNDLYATFGGGEIRFPEGEFRVNLIINEKVTISGTGWRSTILKSVAGSNADVIKGKNFATLTGKTKATGDYLLGAFGVVIRNLTIDGDKATNTSAGYGIRLWGAHPSFENIIVRSCKNDGIYTEFTDHDVFASADEHVQGYFQNLKVIGNDGNAWLHRGPHDSILQNYVAYNNSGWALKTESLADKYTGGISVSMANAFLNANSYYIGAGGYWDSCTASASNVGNGFEIAAGVGGVQVNNCRASGHIAGVIMRGSDNSFTDGFIQSCRNMANSAGDGLILDGASRCIVDFNGNGSFNVISVLSENGANIIRCRVSVPNGKTFITGSAFNIGDSLDLKSVGGVAQQMTQMPSGAVQVLGSLLIGQTGGPQSNDPIIVRFGGDPNGNVSAHPGSLCLNTNGGVGSAIYTKESGAGTNTGWVAK